MAVESILFIVNPISGGKDKQRILALIEKLLDRERFRYEIRPTEYAGHGIELARASKADIVVAVGGDGTVSEVAQGLAGAPDKALGIIPCGSGDGLALHLGISRRPKKAIRQLNRSETAVMDYGTVEGHPFFCTTGVGMDADVAWAFAKSGKRGLKTYVAKTLAVWRHFKPDTYRIEVDGKVHTMPATFVTVANVNQWGNNAVIAPEASVRDGQFDVTVLHPFTLWDVPALGIRLFLRRFTRARKVTSLRGRNIVLQRSSAAPAHFDGDPIEMGTTLHIAMHEAAVRVRVPEGRAEKI